MVIFSLMEENGRKIYLGDNKTTLTKEIVDIIVTADKARRIFSELEDKSMTTFKDRLSLEFSPDLAEKISSDYMSFDGAAKNLSVAYGLYKEIRDTKNSYYDGVFFTRQKKIKEFDKNKKIKLVDLKKEFNSQYITRHNPGDIIVLESVVNSNPNFTRKTYFIVGYVGARTDNEVTAIYESYESVNNYSGYYTSYIFTKRIVDANNVVCTLRPSYVALDENYLKSIPLGTPVLNVNRGLFADYGFIGKVSDRSFTIYTDTEYENFIDTYSFDKLSSGEVLPIALIPCKPEKLESGA